MLTCDIPTQVPSLGGYATAALNDGIKFKILAYHLDIVSIFNSKTIICTLKKAGTTWMLGLVNRKCMFKICVLIYEREAWRILVLKINIIGRPRWNQRT